MCRDGRGARLGTSGAQHPRSERSAGATCSHSERAACGHAARSAGKRLTVARVQETGKREVFFETFGVPRVVEVEDRSDNVPQRTAREKADLSVPGEVGAPMGGDVLEVRLALPSVV